jgi:hypothetical protein
MKRILTILLAVSLGLASCDKFGDTNVSPASLAAPTTRGLLTNSLQSMPGLMMGALGNLYSQYLSEGPYPGGSLYSDKTFSFATWYTGPLYNLTKIIEYNNAGSPYADPATMGSVSNQIAVSRILKAYYFLQMTDRWGDIPYTAALKGAEAFAPVYDKQQDIYTDLFKELKAANDQIKTAEKGVVGDILLNGDMAAWKRFANTTRMIMALRLSKVDPAKGKTEYTSALADGVISSNAQNIGYTFIGGDPNNYNPWYNNYSVSNRNDYALSATMTNYMTPKNDPRMKVYGEVLAGGVVKGLTYGRVTAVNIPAVYSRIGDAFRGAGSKMNIYSYAQVLFMQAEAAKIAYTSGGDTEAETAYKAAIGASWAEQGIVDPAGLATYLTMTGVAYVPATGYSQIMSEKWVANYLKGYEAWNDWRRTGFPALVAAPDATDARGIPIRQAYSTTEASLNGTNYTAAVTAMGGADNNYVKIWWNK